MSHTPDLNDAVPEPNTRTEPSTAPEPNAACEPSAQVEPQQTTPGQKSRDQVSASAPGEHRRRKPALDQKLAKAQGFALEALKALVPAEEIGDGHRVVADDDRLVTHYFPSTKRGYRDWEWYVTLARAPRQTVPTVCETGLLPSDNALLAPEWVPWSERLNEDERSEDERDEDEHGSAPDEHDSDSEDAQTQESTDDDAAAESTEQGSQVLHPDVVADLDDQSGDHHQESDPDEPIAAGNGHA